MQADKTVTSCTNAFYPCMQSLRCQSVSVFGVTGSFLTKHNSAKQLSFRRRACGSTWVRNKKNKLHGASFRPRHAGTRCSALQPARSRQGAPRHGRRREHGERGRRHGADSRRRDGQHGAGAGPARCGVQPRQAHRVRLACFSFLAGAKRAVLVWVPRRLVLTLTGITSVFHRHAPPHPSVCVCSRSTKKLALPLHEAIEQQDFPMIELLCSKPGLTNVKDCCG